MAGARRSTRLAAQIAARQKEEQNFEKTKAYVEQDGYTHLRQLRPFVVASSILDNQGLQNNTPPQTSLMLCMLSNEVLSMIVADLCGNDQIILALTCKHMASLAMRSEIRRITNISGYYLPSDDPVKDAKIPIEQRWHKYGFLLDNFEYWCVTDAIYNQSLDLARRVGMWLGPRHDWCYCFSCGKFRNRNKAWWLRFVKYHNPEALTTTDRQKLKVYADINRWINSTCELRGFVSAKCPARQVLYF